VSVSETKKIKRAAVLSEVPRMLHTVERKITLGWTVHWCEERSTLLPLQVWKGRKYIQGHVEMPSFGLWLKYQTLMTTTFIFWRLNL